MARADLFAQTGEVLAIVSYMGGMSDTGDRYSIQEFKGGHKLWLIAKSQRQHTPGLELSEGAVVRFGKVVMNVKKIGGVKDRETIGDLRTNPKQDTSENNETRVLNEGGQCRICLGETCTSENPFIAPCACDGSLKLIHLQCLREWLKSKLSVRENGAVLCYSWESLSCELCKQPLPETVKCGTTSVDLIDFHQTDLAYLVLEDQRNSEKVLYVISLYPDDSIRIVLSTQGRGHEAEIRISDISVSRLHAIIKFVDGKFYLEDRKSKFGTLVLTRSTVIVRRDSSTSVQVGRTVIEFEAARDVRGLFSCCCRCFRRSTAQVEPDRHPGETFAENERDMEEVADRADSAENASRPSELPMQG